MRSPVAIGALVIATLLASTVDPGRPAAAQTIGSLELVAQSSWVDDGAIFNAQVRVAGASPDSTVVVRVFSPWIERDDFLRRDLQASAPVLELDPIRLSDRQDTSNEVLSLELEVAGPTTPPAPEPPPIDPDADAGSTDDFEPPLPRLETDGQPSVHPVEISLRDADGEVLDSVLTSIIHLPRTNRSAPLRTTLVLEAPAASAIAVDGSSLLSPDDVANIGVLVDAIAAHPDAAVALSISGETLRALERSDDPRARDILTTMRDTFSSEQLLPNPFTNVHEQAWIDADLGPELAQLYLAGAEATIETIGIQPEPRVMLLDRTVTTPGLEFFADHGVEGVVVRPAQITPLDASVFPQALTTSFLIPAADAEPVPALVANGGLANHFTDEEEIAVRANRLLADLTLLSLQNSDVRQAVAINPPDAWEPDATFLNVVLSGLERIPVIVGTSPLDALSNAAFTPTRGVGTVSPPLERPLSPRRRAIDLRSYRTDYSQARTAIASWATVIASDTASTRRLTELLQSSTNVSLADGERRSYINEVYRVIDEQKTDSITTPTGETITVTGRLADVPIVVDNNLTVDASVLLLLDSEKLAFPEGRELDVVLTPGPNRIEIPIEARASGDSPIRIQVFSPDRSILLGSSEILVRTFAFSGVGVIIGAIALTVLLVWWLRHWRRSRITVDEILPTPPSQPDEQLRGRSHDHPNRDRQRM